MSIKNEIKVNYDPALVSQSKNILWQYRWRRIYNYRIKYVIILVLVSLAALQVHKIIGLVISSFTFLLVLFLLLIVLLDYRENQRSINEHNLKLFSTTDKNEYYVGISENGFHEYNVDYSNRYIFKWASFEKLIIFSDEKFFVLQKMKNKGDYIFHKKSMKQKEYDMLLALSKDKIITREIV